jgi:hypothetical protein
MAATARSAEILQQWIDLAEHWSQKAELNGRASGATTKHEAPTAFNIAASLERAKPTLDLQRFNAPDVPLTLIPQEMPQLSSESPAHGVTEVGEGGGDAPKPSQQVASEQKLVDELEDDWTRLIADIRAK